MMGRSGVVLFCMQILVWLLITVSGSAAQANTLPEGPFRLMVLGDSLSASYGIAQQSGWVALLADRLQQQGFPVEVINAAISGDTSAGGRSRLGAALQQHSPQLVLLELGGNDGLQGLPLTALRANLDAMIDQANHASAKVLLLGIKVPPNYGKRYTEAFAQIYVDIARTRQIPLVPFILKDVAGYNALMQGDGIHPTAEAQKQVLDNIWPTLKPLLPPKETASP